MRFCHALRCIALALFACALAVPRRRRRRTDPLDALRVKATPKIKQRSASRGLRRHRGRHGKHIEIVATAQAGARAARRRRRQLKRDARAARSASARALQPRRLLRRLPAVLRPGTYVGRATTPMRPATAQDAVRGAVTTASPPSRYRQAGEPSARRSTARRSSALKVTKNARHRRPTDSGPAVLYNANQHAREWLAAETAAGRSTSSSTTTATPGHDAATDQNGDAIRGEAAGLTKGRSPSSSTRTSCGSSCVANPDGYDFTFSPGNRLWRKNLRDNNGDGRITASRDGVDPNRNFPTNWGYDNEGSSDDPPNETYRGTAPGVRARDEGDGRAAEARRLRVPDQLPHGGRAAALPDRLPAVRRTRADNPIYRGAVRHRRRLGDRRQAFDEGDPRNGRRLVDDQDSPLDATRPDRYDPDLSAELYITNGDTMDDAYHKYGTLGLDARDGVASPAADERLSVFEFQDSRPTSRPSSRRTCRSRSTSPRRPRTRRTRSRTSATSVQDFYVTTFAVSYGDPQTVEVDAKRVARQRAMHYRVNGGRGAAGADQGGAGGERYGSDKDVYYHRLRGVVTGTKPGDDVRGVVRAGERRALAVASPTR